MGKLRRALTLVHLLAESSEGLTLDEMAEALGVNRRTAERLRDALRAEFDIEERVDERTKRFFIRDRLGRAYTRPTAEEVAALEVEVAARRAEGATHTGHLEKLLWKVKSALDDREKRRLAPDLEALVRLQRSRIVAGPLLDASPEALGEIQGAILGGNCVEFEYVADSVAEPKWRRVIPYGLIHGPTTYLIGKIPERDQEPVFFRLDRMSRVHISDRTGSAPTDWDLDAWLGRSFGIWREEHHDVVLRVSPSAAARARQWRFHPGQTIEEDRDELLVRFRAGGLREISEHLFIWGGDIRIEAPEELRAVMRERVLLALGSV
ncbi:WYL domain-containing transcriptional regulator [Sphingomonas sp. LY54]|uniref:helix-turn-helix transcriptional regulator n=1 Tax=Sphingomonas sp. LY54 TaxID=3095343 RepID=UPI002D79F8F9|nr:WYL domain-containing transcriptional regulator [Sphingomonas sp. LY54]WRP29777.1 WYL domain-containing transcriptional regulator [Sphingomonas sp. LY54]